MQGYGNRAGRAAPRPAQRGRGRRAVPGKEKGAARPNGFGLGSDLWTEAVRGPPGGRIHGDVDVQPYDYAIVE